ncbi:RCC1 and BTB domain-containing protein 1 [Folsomia candida]|nr:RCC1 and BTB domain-containing protein 1 [Folsomia candida]
MISLPPPSSPAASPSASSLAMETQLKIWNIFCDSTAEPILRKARLAHVHENVGIIVTIDDDVFLLSRDTSDSEGSSLNVIKVPELCGVRVKEFIMETKYMCIVTKAGDLYSWSRYRIGGGPKDRPRLKLGSLHRRRVSMAVVSPGAKIGLALTDDGQVHQWGCGKKDPFLIEKDPQRERITSLACIDLICLALTKTGEIYYWKIENPLGKPEKMESDLTPFKKITTSKSVIIGLTVQKTAHLLDISADTPVWSPVLIFGVGDIASHFTEEFCLFEVADKIRLGKMFGTNGWMCSFPSSTGVDEIFAKTFQKSHRSIKPRIEMVGPRESGHSLCEDIARLWDANDADVIFSVECKDIGAHRVILKCRSTHFAKMLENEWKEKKESRIVIPDTKYCVFEALLYFIYHAKLNLPSDQYENIFDLMKLADCYCELSLRQECEAILIQNINAENAFFLFQNASQASADELEDQAFKFIVDNRSTLLDNISSSADLENMLGAQALSKMVMGLLRRYR